MKITFVHIGVGILGAALFGRLLIGDGEPSTQAKRNYLKTIDPDSPRAHEVFSLMSDSEISIVYAVITQYGHPNNAPEELKIRFEAIGFKYDIFT